MRALTIRGGYVHVHRPSFDFQVDGFFQGYGFFHRSCPTRLTTYIPPRRESEPGPKSDLFSRPLAFFCGDSARLDTVDLGLIHFDEYVGHVLNFGRVIVWTEQRRGSATAVTQRRRGRFENDSCLGSAVPSPVNLIARNAHDIAGFTAVAPSVNEEKNLSGHDIIHLLA